MKHEGTDFFLFLVSGLATRFHHCTMNNLHTCSGYPVSALMCCITLLFVLVRLKLVLSSVPHCASQMSSPFHLLLFSHSASLYFLLFTPHSSSCTASIQQLYDASICLGYQHGKKQMIFLFFFFPFLKIIIGTVKWLVFKKNPKSKNQGNVILLVSHKDVQYVTMLLCLKCHTMLF